MKKYLVFIFIFILHSVYSQIRLDIWNQSDKMAKTVSQVGSQNLPQAFESKLPDGSVIVYERWERPEISFTTSSGKQSKMKPIVYKSTKDFGLVSYTDNGWMGLHQSSSGKVSSLTYNKVETVSKKVDGIGCVSQFIENSKEDISGQMEQSQMPKVAKTTSTLLRQDFYNPNIPIPVTCSLYVEASNDVYRYFYPTGSGQTQLVMDWLNLCYQGVSLVFFREGINVQLLDVLIWDTPDTYGYTTQINILSLSQTFTTNKSSNLPRATPCFFKQLLVNRTDIQNGDGVAPAAPNLPNGFTSINLPGRLSQTSVVNVRNNFGLPNPIGSTSEYNWTIVTASHEIGHNMGSIHTHDCNFWRNENNIPIARIDSCNTRSFGGPICNPLKVPKDYSIPSIMSYCWGDELTPPFARDFMLQNGFGKLPRFAIRLNVYYSQFTGLKPTVTISNIDGISTTGASITSNLTSFGSLPYTVRGLRIWQTSLGIGTATKINDGSILYPSESIGSYSTNLTNLIPNTNYSIQAYATNPFGESTSQTLTFTTNPVSNCPPNTGIPIVTNTNVTNANPLLSNINIIGNATTTNNIPLLAAPNGIGFSWGLYPPDNPNSFTNSKLSQSSTTTGTVPFTFSLNQNDVSNQFTYYYRTFANSTCGTGFSSVGELSPLDNNLPNVTTLPLGPASASGAILQGSVTSNSPISLKGFEVQSSSLQNLDTYVIPVDAPFDYQWVGSSQPLIYRAFADNQYGRKYGIWRNLILQNTQGVPNISGSWFGTGAYTRLTTNSLTCPIGPCNIISKGVVWEQGVTQPTISLPTKVNLGTSLGSYDYIITGLQPNTQYSMRAYVTFSYQGTQYTFYGPRRISTTSQLGSCQIQNLSAYKNFKWFYKFNLNPSCSTYTVSVSRYSNSNPNVPPTLTSIPITTSDRLTNYLPTPSEMQVLSGGMYGSIDKEMTPQPQLPSSTVQGSWFSVNVTCNGACTGTKPTKTFFYVPRTISPN